MGQSGAGREPDSTALPEGTRNAPTDLAVKSSRSTAAPWPVWVWPSVPAPTPTPPPPRPATASPGGGKRPEAPGKRRRAGALQTRLSLQCGFVPCSTTVQGRVSGPQRCGSQDGPGGAGGHRHRPGSRVPGRTGRWRLAMMTSSSDDLHSTDVSTSVTVPSSSTETTFTGTATVFPVRMAVFRISASWNNKHTCPSHTSRWADRFPATPANAPAPAPPGADGLPSPGRPQGECDGEGCHVRRGRGASDERHQVPGAVHLNFQMRPTGIHILSVW